jgi:lipopolysaccharide transport system permease protein
LWRYRELLFFLVWRDIKVRYRQTVLGAVWAVLPPLATMAIFSLFLGQVAGISTDVPYPLFLFAALIPWTFFASAVGSASNSVVGSQALVTKVYFPRLIIPLSAVGVGLVDFGISFVMLCALMLYYTVFPGVGVLLVPVLALLLMLSAFGVGTLLAALSVAYRDFRYVVPVMIQLWMYATPCIYLDTDKVVGPTAKALLPLNPAYGLVSNFRQAMLGQPLDLYSLAISAAVSIALLLIGSLYFCRVERSFADVI